MKTNNGFTLIELLATIIILAAIALVAFPILLNTINNSENKIDGATRKIVESAAKLYVDDNLNEYPLVNRSTYCVPFNELINGNYLEKGIIDTTNIDFSEKTVKVTVNDQVNYEIVNTNACASTKKICAIQSGSLFSFGSKYSCDVGDGQTRNFYLLGYNSDESVNLIMDSNINRDGDPINDENYVFEKVDELTTPTKDYIYWNRAGAIDEGPVAALEFLHDATKDWVNVPDMIIDHADVGQKYNSIKTNNYITTIKGGNNQVTTIGTAEYPLKARLPIIAELKSNGCRITSDCSSNESFNTCPEWLTNYLYQSHAPHDNPIDGIKSYWTLDSIDGEGDYVYAVGFNSDISTCSEFYLSKYMGVRPVITILKSQITK